MGITVTTKRQSYITVYSPRGGSSSLITVFDVLRGWARGRTQ